MALSFDLNRIVSMQQLLAGPGVFNGSYVGRASVAIGAGASQVLFRARKYGTDGNAITVELFNAGAPTVVLTTTVQLLGANVVRVILRRNAGAILATADEVVLAINNYRNTSNPTQQLPCVATAAAAGVMVAAGATPLTGGLDPAIVGPMDKFSTIGDGGLFYFDQSEVIVVKQLLCKFVGMGGAVTVQFQIANLDAGLQPIAAETATVFSGAVGPAQPYVSFADAQFLLLPRQALLVVTPAGGLTGMAQIDVQNATAQ